VRASSRITDSAFVEGEPADTGPEHTGPEQPGTEHVPRRSA
jgi:hypothetical protein